jgi:hypothetical protein
MKKLICRVCIAIMFASCGQKITTFENSAPQKKWEIMRDHYMVPGAPVSDERPLPNVLSEQEVLLKAADYAILEGVLHPSYYAYEETPELMTAKIETPILLTDAVTGVPDTYMLTAVDDAGVLLAEVFVNSAVNTNGAKFENGRSFAIPNTSFHHITKQEAVELIQAQFPGSTVSQPMAVYNLRLGEDPHSHRALFWYFTVDGNARSAAEESGEYIIAAGIFGYRFISGGVSNRAAINTGRGGSPHLGRHRMAKLDTPLRLFNKLDAARAAGGASFTPSRYPDETVGFTPVPLK